MVACQCDPQANSIQEVATFCFACCACSLHVVVALPNLCCVGGTHTYTPRLELSRRAFLIVRGSNFTPAQALFHVSLQVMETEMGDADRSPDAQRAPTQEILRRKSLCSALETDKCASR